MNALPDWMQQATAQAEEQKVKPLLPPVPGRVLHMDGDLLAYWAGGSEDTTVAESRQRATDKINALRDQSRSESVVLHLTASSSTKGDRFIIATIKPYQGQRKSGRKPKNWGYLRDWLEGYQGHLFRSKLWATREADDGVALCAHVEMQHHELGTAYPVAIASADKDFRMIPGVHVNWNTYDLTEVPFGAYDVRGADGLQYGYKWFFLQLLQGDTADNIPGLERYNGKPIGPAGAEAALRWAQNVEQAWATVYGCYSENYGTEAKERLVEQAMLLWLRTDAAAHVGNFASVLNHPGFDEHIASVERRIKDAYAEAQKYASLAAPQ